MYLRGIVSETPDVSTEISRWTRACWMRVKKYAVQLYDRPTVPLDLKARMVKAEAAEALLYGSVSWTLRQGHYKKAPHGTPPGVATVDRGTTVSSRTAKHYRRLTARALRRLPGRKNYCGRGALCGWMPDGYPDGSSWGTLTARGRGGGA